MGALGWDWKRVDGLWRRRCGWVGMNVQGRSAAIGTMASQQARGRWSAFITTALCEKSKRQSPPHHVTAAPCAGSMRLLRAHAIPQCTTHLVAQPPSRPPAAARTQTRRPAPASRGPAVGGGSSSNTSTKGEGHRGFLRPLYVQSAWRPTQAWREVVTLSFRHGAHEAAR